METLGRFGLAFLRCNLSELIYRGLKLFYSRGFD